MKEKILDVAAELIQKYGLRKFTMDEIASELHISKKTLYQHFKSKNDVVRAYFETTLASHRDSVIQALNSEAEIFEKINSIIYSIHRYRLPIALLNEAKQFYPDEWAKIVELKNFKIDALKQLLEHLRAEGNLKSNVHFGVLSKMLGEIGNMFIDYDFLLENKLKTSEAIEKALAIVLHGIMK